MAGIDYLTKLCLHMDGDDASTTFTDSSASAHTVTAVGNAQIDTAQQKFGTGSGLFDGTGDYLTIPDSSDFNFASGAFTIDFWARPTTLTGSSNYILCTHVTDGSNYMVMFADNSNSNKITFKVTVAGVDEITLTESSATLSAGTWTHHAVVRYGDVWALFGNGTMKATVTDSQVYPDLTGVFSIAGNFTPGTHATWNGHLDEFRISKGVARWAANFAVPTAAYNSFLNRPGAMFKVFDN